MLTMLGSPRRCCDGLTRRETLQAGALTLLGNLFRLPSLHASSEERVVPTRPDPLFTGLDEEARFYFVHSYYVAADDPAQVLAQSNYGGDFVSAVRRDNVWGMQYHPEKSHKFGLTVIRNFVALPAGAPA